MPEIKELEDCEMRDFTKGWKSGMLAGKVKMRAGVGETEPIFGFEAEKVSDYVSRIPNVTRPSYKAADFAKRIYPYVSLIG
jgi:hypothetical protein